MDLPDRHVLLGMTLGVLAATAIAFTGPGMVVETFADELMSRVIPQGFDPSRLVRFEGRNFTVRSEDWVSDEPISTAVVKKVEGGRVSYVTITTTDTGVYSTDAMFSGNVKYPGIEVEQEFQHAGNQFASWNGGSWHGFTSSVANSFSYYRSGSTGVSTRGDVTCVFGATFRVC